MFWLLPKEKWMGIKYKICQVLFDHQAPTTDSGESVRLSCWYLLISYGKDSVALQTV